MGRENRIAYWFLNVNNGGISDIVILMHAPNVSLHITNCNLSSIQEYYRYRD